MLRAVAYQIWQSTLAWVELRPDEALYLEGAEDFDIFRPDCAEAVQVFDSTRKISLRTQKVLEAVANFWTLSTSDPDRKVSLRFLSRAEPAVEQGAPFGADVAGLDLWRRRRLTDAQIESLSAFLSEMPSLPEGLREFLRREALSKRRSFFFERISWDLGQPDASVVEKVVSDKLAVLGESYGLTYSDAAGTRRRLFDEVLKTASVRDSARCLTRPRLLEVFEQEAFVRVSRTELHALRQQTVQSAPQPLIELQIGAPPLPTGAAMREALVAGLCERLQALGMLVLFGSAGMGKTMVAKLVVNRADGTWHWLSMTQRSPAEITRVLNHLNARLDRDPAITAIVLDDMDLRPDSARVFEEALALLCCRMAARRGQLVITSQKPPPTRFVSNGWITAAAQFRVPYLDHAELARMTWELGCSDVASAEQWAVVVLARTEGHPQLARAFVAGLREQGWPPVATNALAGNPTQLRDEKADARQLVQRLPESDRELLYRLTLIRSPFRRDHAVAIGGSPPPLAVPGPAFERLRDCWIDALHGGYFRASPLLDGAANEDLPPNRVRELHVEIAKAMCQCPPATYREAGTAFHHVWLAKEESALIGMATDFMSQEKATFSGIARELFWFLSEGLAGNSLYPTNLAMSNALRCLQARVAVEAGDAMATTVFAAWHEELFRPGHDARLEEKLLLISHALTFYQARMSARRVVEYFRLYVEAEGSIPDFPNLQMPGPVEILGEAAGRITDPVAHLGMMLVPRCESVAFLDELLDALDEIPATLRTRIFAGLRLLPLELRLLIDKVWLAESDRGEPDWPSCLATLRKAVTLGVKWEILDLAVAAVKALSLIQDEYLHDRTAALAELDRAAADLRLDSHLIDDQRALVLFHLGRHSEAISLWEKAFAQWPAVNEPHDSTPALAARFAGMAAAAGENWLLSGQWFRRGYESLARGGDQALAAGLLTDAAFAFWRGGAKAECVKAFGDALPIVDALPTGKQDLRAFKARKIFGHMLLWVDNSVYCVQHDQLSEPKAGLASDPEAREQFRDLPESDPEIFPVLLLRIALRFGCDTGLFEWLTPRLDAARSIAVRLMHRDLLVRRVLQRAELADLPRLASNYRGVADEGRAALPADHPLSVSLASMAEFPRGDNLLGPALYALALVAHAARGGNCCECVERWSAASQGLPAAAGFGEWFREMAEALARDRTASDSILRAGGQTWEAYMLAALHLATAWDCSPAQLIRAHSFLLCELPVLPLFPHVETALVELVSSAWRRTSAKSLIPDDGGALLASCESPVAGAAKAARIVLCAITAVGMPAQPALIEKLKVLAGNA